MSRGYPFEVAEEVKEDFYCIICTNLMRDAVQLKCGHGMCKSCLDSWEDSRKKVFLELYFTHHGYIKQYNISLDQL